MANEDKVNLIKLFAPEQIPLPRQTEGPEWYKYTKDLYDYLRRLAQIFGIAISQNLLVDELVLRKRWSVTANGTVYLDSTNDWRSRVIRHIGLSDGSATPENDLYPGGSFSQLTFYAGSNFANGGGDFQFNQLLFGGMQVNFYIEDGTGFLKYTVIGYGPTTNTIVIELRGSPKI